MAAGTTRLNNEPPSVVGSKRLAASVQAHSSRCTRSEGEKYVSDHTGDTRKRALTIHRAAGGRGVKRFRNFRYIKKITIRST